MLIKMNWFMALPSFIVHCLGCWNKLFLGRSVAGVWAHGTVLYWFINHDTVVDGGVLCRYASCILLRLYMDPLFPSSRKTESNNDYVLISSVQVLLTEVYNLLVMPIPQSTFYWLTSLMHQAYVNMLQCTSHAQYFGRFSTAGIHKVDV